MNRSDSVRRTATRSTIGRQSLPLWMSSSLWLAVLVVALLLPLHSTAQSCTPCFGTPELPVDTWTGTSALGLSCAFAASLTEDATSDTPGCQSAQLTLFQGCGCDAYDEGTFCSMCGGPTVHTDPNTEQFVDITNADATSPRNTPVPLFPGKTCEDLLFPRWDDDETMAIGELVTTDRSVCANVQRAAAYCGCPNANNNNNTTTPLCEYCNGRVPQFANALVPPTYTQTCRDWYDLTPFYITAESCQVALTARAELVDDALYCGCPDSTMDGGGGGASLVDCDLCQGDALGYPDWMVVVAPGVNMVCREVARLAAASVDADFCTQLMSDFGDACCRGILPPTDAPTDSPSTPSDSTTASPTIVPDDSSSSSLNRARTVAMMESCITAIVMMIMTTADW